MMDLEKYAALVESAIKTLGVKPEDCKGENKGQWNLVRGSAKVWVDIFLSRDNSEYGYIQIMSPICDIPEDRKMEFYKELLEINHDLYGVGFTKKNDIVYIRVIRELEGISESEILAMLRRVGTYADDYDDYLKNKYIDNLSGGNAPQ